MAFSVVLIWIVSDEFWTSTEAREGQLDRATNIKKIYIYIASIG
jgi:hypothetical protein